MSEPLWTYLVAGGCAGTAVDIFFFPLDTIKTRLQAQGGFLRAGGFRGVYRGLSAAALASAPAAGGFFTSYEATKSYLETTQPNMWGMSRHMLAASVGEVVSALVRVPFETVKQQLQAGVFHTYPEAARSMASWKGLVGLSRSYVSLVAREVPFALLQYPLYEYFKASVQQPGGDSAPTWQLSLCGSLAGGLAAAVTTPLDVAKTRVVLQGHAGTAGTYSMMRHVLHTEGPAALFAGIVPRVVWISVGGAVFFGMYEACRGMLRSHIA